MLTEFPNREGIIDQFQTVSGCKGPWPDDWKSNRINLYRIQVCTRQLSRTAPMETADVEFDGSTAAVPTDAEILRIKCGLIFMRNQTRDYLDMAIFTSRLGSSVSAETLKDFDRQFSTDERRLMLVQLIDMLSTPLPYDFSDAYPKEAESLAPEWQKWDRTLSVLLKLAIDVFDASCRGFIPRPYEPEE
jgi:hypothetical protein